MSLELHEYERLRWPLVKRFYKANGHKGAPKGGERIFVLSEQNKILVAVRLCPLKQERGLLLRSLWVDQKKRGQGLGSALLSRLAPLLLQQPVWCYPYPHLEQFYQRAGFQACLPEQAPELIRTPWQRYQQQGHHFLLMRYQPENLCGNH